MNIEPVSRFSELHESAVELFVAQRDRDLFLCDYWFELIEQRVFCTDHDIQYLQVIDGASVCAVLPVVRSGHGFVKRSTLRGRANYYSTSFGLITNDQSTESFASICQALASFLAAATPRIAHLELSPWLAPDSEFETMIRALSAHGFHSERFRAFGNYYDDVKGVSFADYLAARPGKLRSLLKRRGKKFSNDCEARFELITSPDSLERHLSEYEQVYQARGRLTEPYPSFIRDVVQRIASEQRLRLGLLYADGQPVAAQIWFINAASASLFKSAFDPSWGKYSTGSLLSAFLIEHFLERDRVSAIDFLSGDDAYKKDWASQHQVVSGIEAINRSHLLGRARLIKRRLRGG